MEKVMGAVGGVFLAVWNVFFQVVLPKLSKVRFIVAAMMVLLSSLLGSNVTYAMTSPSESPATPWYIAAGSYLGIPQDCLDETSQARAQFYSDPNSAVAAFAGALDEQYSLGWSENNLWGTGQGLAYIYFIGSDGSPCNLDIVVSYDGHNFGQVCPDGSYVEGGQSCSGSGPIPAEPGQSLGSGCGCSGQNIPGAVSVGEPIDIGTGNVSDKVNDYATSGANVLDFSRYYNSRALSPTSAVSLGSNWRTTYDRYLDIVSSTSIVAERASGQFLNFTLNNGIWTSDSDIDYTLTQAGSTWILTDNNDNVETYIANGANEAFLSAVKTRSGYTQTLTYNTTSQLVSVTDSFSRKLVLTYTGTLLNTVTTPSGLVITYNYDSSGLNPGVNDRLASVSYSTSPVTSQSYSYTQNFDLTNITDENGNTYASWTYDTAGRGLTTQLGSGANLYTIAYDDSTGNRTVTNPLGQQEVYKFTTLQGVPKVTEIDRAATSTVAAASETFTYDSNGYMAGETDWNGNVTHYTNDVHGQPTSITEAYGTPQARTTTISYNSTFVHLPSQITAPGKTTTFTYDSKGNLLTQTDTDTTGGPTNGQTRTWKYTYDSLGHLLTVKDPAHNGSKENPAYIYTYTGDNIATITDALGHVSHITSYNNSGLPLSMTDPNGVVTTFTYDARQRLLTRTVQASSGNATTTFAYDAAGNITTLTLPDSSSLSYTYDTAHRVTSVKDNLNGTIAYTLDANGDITQQHISAGSTLAQTQSAVFDSLGQTLQQMGISGQTSSFTYDADGNVLTSTNPLGNTLTQTFDPLNRLVNSIDPLNKTTTYAYDAQDNVTSVTDPRGLTTTYTYDGFGEVLSESSPDQGTTKYTYDKNGNLISTVDARGVTTKRTYDALNRVTALTHPDGLEPISYSYDTGSFGIGRLSGFTDESGSTAYTYNERGDILTETQVIGGVSSTTSYAYNLADRIMSITYPSGHSITYTRDNAGNITSVALSGISSATLANNITYEPFGPVSGFTYGNGLTTTLTYDQDYRLTGIKTSGSNVNVQDLSFAYDNANDITSITDGLDATQDQSFTYDADQRLLSAVGVYGTDSYTYDADGNRLTSSEGGVTSTYTYPTTSNQLATVVRGSKTRKLSYNAAGDITSDNRATSPNAKYTYNKLNQLETVAITGGATTTYIYNALGERTSQAITGGATTNYVYDLQGHLIAETDQTGALLREYVYLGDTPLAQIEGNGTIYYVHTDQSGTPQKMTDAGQHIVWDRTQQPFGQSVSITGTAVDNIRFPGQYADGENGLNYNGNRYYDPTLGRYTQADPTGLNGGINLYAYVAGNPVTGVDPWGLTGEWDCAKLGNCSNLSSPNITTSSFLNTLLFASMLIPGEGEVVVGAKICEEAVPSILARVIPVGTPEVTLSLPTNADVFVTAAEDIAGLNAAQIAERLTIPQSETGFKVFEFTTPSEGLATPVFRTDPGFIQGGSTAGGAREFIIPNGPIPPNATMRIVQ
jgi:RHS repeat-associated protein